MSVIGDPLIFQFVNRDMTRAPIRSSAYGCCSSAKLKTLKFNNNVAFFGYRSNSLSWCTKPWCFQLPIRRWKNGDSNTLSFKNVCIIVLSYTIYRYITLRRERNLPCRMLWFVDKLTKSPQNDRVMCLEY